MFHWIKIFILKQVISCCYACLIVPTGYFNMSQSETCAVFLSIYGLSESEQGILHNVFKGQYRNSEVLYVEYPERGDGYLGDRKHYNGIKAWKIKNSKIVSCNYCHFTSSLGAQFKLTVSNKVLPESRFIMKFLNHCFIPENSSIRLLPCLEKAIKKSHKFFSKSYLRNYEKTELTYFDLVTQCYDTPMFFYLGINNNIVGIIQHLSHHFDRACKALSCKKTSYNSFYNVYYLFNVILKKAEDIKIIYRNLYDEMVFDNLTDYEQLWLAIRLCHPEYEPTIYLKKEIEKWREFEFVLPHAIWDNFSISSGKKNVWKFISTSDIVRKNFYDEKYILMEIDDKKIRYSISKLNIIDINALCSMLSNNPPLIPTKFNEMCRKYNLQELNKKEFWRMVIKMELFHKGHSYLCDNMEFDENINSLDFSFICKNPAFRLLKIKPYHLVVCDIFSDGVKSLEHNIFCYSAATEGWGICALSILRSQVTEFVRNIGNRISSKGSDAWLYNESRFIK